MWVKNIFSSRRKLILKIMKNRFFFEKSKILKISKNRKFWIFLKNLKIREKNLNFFFQMNRRVLIFEPVNLRLIPRVRCCLPIALHSKSRPSVQSTVSLVTQNRISDPGISRIRSVPGQWELHYVDFPKIIKFGFRMVQKYRWWQNFKNIRSVNFFN